MRSLTFFSLFLSLWCRAESLQLSTNFNNTNRNTTLSHDSSTEVSTLSTTLEYVSKRLGSFQNYLSFRQDLVDYSDYIISDSLGEESRLSDTVDHDVEYYADNTLEYSNSGLTLGLSFFGHLSESPFKSRGMALRLTQDFFKKTSTVGVEFTRSRNDMPESYSATEKRPTRIDIDYLKVFYQQILGANSKARLNFLTGRRKQDRPRHYGVIGEYGHAWSDLFFSQLKLTYIEEGRGQELLDERGYYSLAQVQLQFTYEPIYDLLLSASYALSREIEDDPRQGNKNQVGIDTYSLGLRYLFNDFEIEFLGSITASNTEAEDYSLAGGVKWLL